MIWRMCDFFKNVYLFQVCTPIDTLVEENRISKKVVTCLGINVMFVKKGSEEDVYTMQHYPGIKKIGRKWLFILGNVLLSGRTITIQGIF